VYDRELYIGCFKINFLRVDRLDEWCVNRIQRYSCVSSPLPCVCNLNDIVMLKTNSSQSTIFDVDNDLSMWEIYFKTRNKTFKWRYNFFSFPDSQIHNGCDCVACKSAVFLYRLDFNFIDIIISLSVVKTTGRN